MGILSVKDRNALVEEYLWCIDSIMGQNATLIRAAHLDRDDVYQSLAARLIRTVELYKPSKKGDGSLKGYIFMSLGFELRSCSSAQTRYGLKNAPHFLRNPVVSIDALAESDPYWEMKIAA